MRKLYIDNIRWMTILVVWVYHVFYMFNSCGVLGGIGPFHEGQVQDAILYLIYPWFMALLFLVAGISAKSYLETHTDKEFIKTRTVKLLVPSTIGVLTFQWIQGYISMNMGDGMDLFGQVPGPILYMIMCLSGIGVLWFVQLLWVLSLVLVLVKKIEKGRLHRLCENIPLWGILLLVVPYWGFAQILNTPMITVYRFGLYGFAFLIGYYVFSHETIINKLTRICWPLILCAIVLGAAFTCLEFGKNFADNPVFNSVLSMVFSYAAILAILGGMKKWGDKTNQITVFMSKKAWGFYIFHYLGISAAAQVLVRNTTLAAIVIYIASALAGLFTGFVLPEIISRIPVIRWCVMGIKKADKKS